MAKVVNPETESITLNTQLELPTLEPATDLEQPLPESTSNTEPVEVVETPALDADAPTEPVAEPLPVAEATAEAPPAAEVATEVPAPAPVVHTPAPQAPAAPVDTAAPHSTESHGLDSIDDFSAAL